MWCIFSTVLIFSEPKFCSPNVLRQNMHSMQSSGKPGQMRDNHSLSFRFLANWVHHALQAPQSIKAQKPKLIHDSGRLEELTGEELCCCTHWKLHNAKNSHNWLTYRAISQNQLVVDERLKSKKLPKKVSRQSGCFRQSQVKDKPLMKSPIW